MVRTNINTYLPPLFRNIEELRLFHEIMDGELKDVYDGAKTVLDAAIVTKTNENTIQRWEHDFDVLPAGRLVNRQDTILSILRSNTPFSKTNMKKYLTEIVGPEHTSWNVEYDHRPEKKLITITIDVLNEFAMMDVIKYFKRTTPLDYGFTIRIRYRVWLDYRDIAIWAQLVDYTWTEMIDGVPYAVLKGR